MKKPLAKRSREERLAALIKLAKAGAPKPKPYAAPRRLTARRPSA
jgi:hypothetical protein